MEFIKIEKKVLHKEWDEVSFTIDQFVKFNEIYCKINPYDDLYPTFVFDSSEVYVDESWSVDEKGRISISSYENGIVGFSEERGQYMKHYHQVSKEIGQLISVTLNTSSAILEVLNNDR